MGFFKRFESLCRERGISPNAAAKEMGIPSGSITAWKNGAEPRLATLKRIADYFGVSAYHLLGGGPKDMAAADEDGELWELLEEARRRPDLRVLFSLGRNATPEEVKKYINVIKAICGDNDE